MKKCGLVIRVSTDRQAQNKEGSLTNQLQRLHSHIEYKNVACGEQWVEAERYVLKAISGKDSFRSREFTKLFEDMRTGRVDTVLCTALDRICRSVKDFLNFFEILNKYNVEFVCLKQNYDTTTSQGKLFITIMMALAEFEREQTSERNKDATLARANRGLWNGGQILGYDLDANRRGNLVPNEKEKIVVNFAYDTYLKTGSLLQTAKALNAQGFRTKVYSSRRDKHHPAKEFAYSTIQWMLTNYAYIGKKEVNKKRKVGKKENLPENECYKLIDAVWEGIVSEEKFYQVQDLLKKNNLSNHNKVKPVKHNYILNSGLLWCEKCGTEMEGCCGTKAGGKRYYYYRCKNEACRFKVPADEVEGVVLARIRELAMREDIIAGIVQSANSKLQKEMPQLNGQLQLLQNELAEVKNNADGIMNKWLATTQEDGQLFFKEKLNQLGKRRKELESGILAVGNMVNDLEREKITQEVVAKALKKFGEVFAQIQPHQQKDLLKLTVHKILLSEDKIKIALYGKPPDIGLLTICKPEEQSRSQASVWLSFTDYYRTYLSMPRKHAYI
ncbi:MAG: recombinase family protein [Elusimicrobia bacterium]|nr:recombinase family protein [Elusimicrobiota bacterium]